MSDRAMSGQGWWRPAARLLGAQRVGALLVDAHGAIAYANPSADRLFGSSAGGLAGEMVRGCLAAESEWGGFDEVLRQVLSGDCWNGILPMLVEGRRQTMSTSWSPVDADGEMAGVLILVEPAVGDEAQAGALARRFRRLASVTRELLFAADVDAVAKLVCEHVTEAAGATVGSLSLLVDPDTLALVGIHGGRPGVASRWATYPLADSTPAGDAVRSRRPLVLDHAEIRRRYPDLERAAEGARLIVCLPLQVADRPLGVVSLSFPGRRSIDAAELEFFRLLADTSAQAVDRLQAQAEAADREAKLGLLAAASAELSSSLDYETTLQSVARLAVPWFADWCGISLEHDGRLRPVAFAHVDSAKVALAWDLNHRYPPDPDASRGSYAVLRSGRSELFPDVPDDLLVAVARDEEHLRILRDLDFRSSMQVPLQAQGRVLGVITWVTGEQGRRFDEEDLAFGEDLARRAAAAIDNSELHTELRQVAVRLQKAVLPDVLPDLPQGWQMAARYIPAGRTEASGDFYEVLPLTDGRVVLFVGDVMGRGVRATATMAQMRASVRALAAVDPEPRSVLTGLDRLFEQFDQEQLVTLVYVILDGEKEQVQAVNAGHPSPIIVRASGDIEHLVTDDTMILGAGGGDRAVLTRPFRDGDILVAFTDGLVERRDEDIDVGVGRLAQECHRLRGRPLADALDGLVEEIRDHTRDDDVAAIAVRRGHTSSAG